MKSFSRWPNQFLIVSKQLSSDWPRAHTSVHTHVTALCHLASLLFLRIAYCLPQDLCALATQMPAHICNWPSARQLLAALALCAIIYAALTPPPQSKYALDMQSAATHTHTYIWYIHEYNYCVVEFVRLPPDYRCARCERNCMQARLS